MDKLAVVNRLEYTIYLEYFDDVYFLHTDVVKWSPDIKRKYLVDLDLVQELLGTELYGLVESTNKKLSKFGKTIGFTYVKNITGNDSKVYEIYKRGVPWVA